MSDSAPIVIAVPTFRRLELLGALLESLREEVEPGSCTHIVVGDNDCSEDVRAEILRRRAEGLPVSWIGVPERGISQVRNELIREATRACPQWRFVVMLDDDGTVQPGWLAALTAAARLHDPDVLAGPVLGQLPPGASILARNSVYAGRPRLVNGPVAMLNGAQNIAISRRICDALGDPWFDAAFGLSGGEDYRFFRRVVAAGGRLAWCDEARVLEPTPVQRLGWRPLMRRAFLSNALTARTDIDYLGREKVWRDLRQGVRANLREMAAGVVRRDADRIVRAGLNVVGLAGRASALRSGNTRQITHDY